MNHVDIIEYWQKMPLRKFAKKFGYEGKTGKQLNALLNKRMRTALQTYSEAMEYANIESIFCAYLERHGARTVLDFVVCTDALRTKLKHTGCRQELRSNFGHTCALNHALQSNMSAFKFYLEHTKYEGQKLENKVTLDFLLQHGFNSEQAHGGDYRSYGLIGTYKINKRHKRHKRQKSQ